MLLATATTLSKQRRWVYILACAHSTYYVGFTTNLHNRLRQHFSGEGAIFTKIHRPMRVVKTLPAKWEWDEFQTWKHYARKYGLTRVGGYNPEICAVLGFEWPFQLRKRNSARR